MGKSAYLDYHLAVLRERIILFILFESWNILKAVSEQRRIV